MTEPTTQEWRDLFEAADKVKKLKPWKWMKETNIFGVQNPENGELGFVSVMGMAGEHFAVALYQGIEALNKFWMFNFYGEHMDPLALLHTRQLQVSFENRKMFDERDHKLIKSLGLKFRGRKQWIQFREYAPSTMPWYLNAEQARFLTHALNQLLDVAPRFRDDPDLFISEEDDGDAHRTSSSIANYFFRVAEEKDGELVWHDEFREVNLQEDKHQHIDIKMDMALLEEVKQMPQGNRVVELDPFILREPIQESPDVRPVFPHAVMMADAQNGTILGMELMTPLPTMESMYGELAFTTLGIIAKMETRPKTIKIRGEFIRKLIADMAKEIEVDLLQVENLPAVDKAKKAFAMQFDV